MKKLGVVFMLFLIASTVFAGGKTEGPMEEKIVFGYVAYQLIDVWNAYTMKGFKYAAAKKGVEVIEIDPEGNQENPSPPLRISLPGEWMGWIIIRLPRNSPRASSRC